MSEKLFGPAVNSTVYWLLRPKCSQNIWLSLIENALGQEERAPGKNTHATSSLSGAFLMST